MLRLLLSLALPATLLIAQGGPPMSSGMGRSRRMMSQDEILARLHRLRMERLQQSLGIPEEKARLIADRWALFDQQSQEARRTMRGLHHQVNDILRSPASEEEKNARIRPLVERFSALRQRQHEARSRFEDDIRGQLTPAQQGRFLLVMEEIQAAMMDAIRQQRMRGRNPDGE